MIVLINGSFGVGKTTVARLLRKTLPGAMVYDPEWAGLVLMRLPRWLKLRGSGTDDFQDIDLWRRSAVAGSRLFRLFASGPLLIPMTFSRREYFDEVVAGLKQLDPEVRVFCLKANLPTIKSRLAGRGDQVESPATDWIARRIVECAEAHRDFNFGDPVETDDRPALEVATDIAQRLNRPEVMTSYHRQAT